eukprot:9043245-Prorocentrum_lima.AAC.1
MIARPRDAGDITLEDPREDIALSIGNGPPHEKLPQFLCSTCSTYYDIEAGREPDAAYMKGK